MYELKDKVKIKNKKELEEVPKMGSMKLFMPRDVQNANSLILSQINSNKYSWEIDGERVK